MHSGSLIIIGTIAITLLLNGAQAAVIACSSIVDLARYGDREGNIPFDQRDPTDVHTRRCAPYIQLPGQVADMPYGEAYRYYSVKVLANTLDCLGSYQSVVFHVAGREVWRAGVSGYRFMCTSISW